MTQGKKLFVWRRGAWFTGGFDQRATGQTGMAGHEGSPVMALDILRKEDLQEWQRAASYVWGSINYPLHSLPGFSSCPCVADIQAVGEHTLHWGELCYALCSLTTGFPISLISPYQPTNMLAGLWPKVKLCGCLAWLGKVKTKQCHYASGFALTVTLFRNSDGKCRLMFLSQKFYLRIYQLHIGSIHMLVGSNSVLFFLNCSYSCLLYPF